MSLHLSAATLVAATVWLLALNLAAWTLGHVAFFGRARRVSSLQDVATAIVLGLTFIGSGCLALLMVRGVYPLTIGFLVLAPAAFGISLLQSGTLPFRAVTNSLRRLDPVTLVMAGVLLCFVPVCFVPPLYHDSLTYHLTFPDLYLRTHGFLWQPYNLNVNLPHYIEVLLTPAALFGGPVTPTLLMWEFAVLAVLGLRSLARSLGMSYLTGPALLLLIASPIVRWHFYITYIELALGCLLVHALRHALLWRTSRNPRALIACGWLVGWMMGCKYTLWYMMLGVPATVLWTLFQQRSQLKQVRHVYLKSAGAAALAVGPWLIRNWILLGNPVYPNARRLFGSRWWSDILDFQTNYKFAHIPILESHGRLVTFLRKPWDLVFHPDYYLCEPFAAVFIGSFVFSFLSPKSYRGNRRFIALTAGLAYLTWAIMPTPANEGRYLVAAAPLMALHGAMLLSLLRPYRLLSNFALVCVAMLSMSSYSAPVFSWERLFTDGLDRVFQSVNPTLGWNEELNRRLPPKAKVLYMFDHLSLGLRADRWFESIYEGPVSMQLIRGTTSGAEAAARLRSLGITHLVVNPVNANWRYFDNAAEVTKPGVFEKADLDRERAVFEQLTTSAAKHIAKVGDWDLLELPDGN